MGQVLVRNLDEQVIEQLRAKAALKGHSLEQELREVLTAAAPLSPSEKAALFEGYRSRLRPITGFDIHAAIRSGRDDEFDK